MKKAEILATNDYALRRFREIVASAFYDGIEPYTSGLERPLDSTSTTFNYGGFLWLRSNDTIVAVYDPATNDIINMSRYLLAYPATSAKHIAKFRRMIQRNNFAHGNVEPIEFKYYNL